MAVDVEAEDVAGVGIAAEHGADGVVRADVFEVEAAGGDVAAVDVGAVADLGDVGLGVGEDFEELGFERRRAGRRRRAWRQAGGRGRRRR